MMIVATRVRAAAAALTVLGVLLMLAGCSVVPERPAPPPSTTTGPPDASPATGGPPGKRTVHPAWAPNLGPIDPNSPPEHRWYQSVQDRDCAGLLAKVNQEQAGETTRAVYGGLAQACLSQWSAAEATLAGLGDGVSDDCYVVSAYQTLRRIVEAHRAAPDVAVEPGDPAAATCAVNPPDETSPEESPSAGPEPPSPGEESSPAEQTSPSP
jgi:hypothetical protein